MFTIIQSHKTENLLHHLGQSYSYKLDNDNPTNKFPNIFEQFVVLVPSMVLGEWLQKAIATNYGISTLVTTTFWGQYQWQIMQMVLEQYNQKLYSEGKGSQVVKVPEVAVLSSTVMQWRLFAYLVNQQAQILADENSPLHAILKTVIGEIADKQHPQQGEGRGDSSSAELNEKNEKRLWQLAKDFAKVYNRYLTHRSQWLDNWENDTPVPIKELIAKKDFLNQKFDNNATLTPEWLAEHYIELEVAQRYLWRVLFAGAYRYRRQIEQNFWQGIADTDVRLKSGLPDCLYLFTVQQLPLSELEFLKRLSQFVDVKLFHYNPSMMFWADIVDKKWLAHQQIINPKNVYLRDYGHTLLSRLGKQSRETFATLATLAGNEDYQQFQLDWLDDFPESDIFLESLVDEFNDIDATENQSSQVTGSQISLLQRLQYDVLMLEESATQQQASQQVVQALQNSLETGDEQILEDELKQKSIPNNRQWQLGEDYSLDDSLQIHSCHSLQRQLEVLRGRIAYWLNQDSQPPRQLSDIVVLLPDVEANDDLIRSVFVDGMGQDGLWLPARVTGVVDKSIRQLWQAICGYYRLLGAKFSRFEATEVIEWLTIPTMVASLGLTTEQMNRGCELLVEAGFIRGFDEEHLQLSLDNSDHDYRFSFAYALDKLVLGLTMPQAKVTDCLYADNYATIENTDTESLDTESLNIESEEHLTEQTLPSSLITLSDAPIIDALCRVYQSLNQYRHEYSKSKRPIDWIDVIENQVIHPLFSVYDQTKEMRAIFSAMNGFRRSLRANERPTVYYPDGHISSSDLPLIGEDNNNNKSALNLRLEFVLESIEESLESQQISAEPTGVITFARFGSLRTVPYRLVVMLNMNLSEFPRQDKDDRYDLMKAGLSERGDRSGEDDDNGAFLDALLCATDNCWIFYNGRSLHDTNEHLPANPVSELLQFLQGEVKWQGADRLLESGRLENQTSDLTKNIEQYLPRLIEDWLVTQHPPLPFSPQIFEQNIKEELEQETKEQVAHQDEQATIERMQKLLAKQLSLSKLKQQQQIPPAPLWSHVYQQLHDSQQQQQQKQPNNAVNLLSMQQYQQLAKLLTGSEELSILTFYNEQNEYNGLNGLNELGELLLANLPTHLDINQLASQVANPAIRYLRKQQVKIADDEEMLNRQEPLALGALANYQLKDELIKNLSEPKSTTNKLQTSKVHNISEIQQLLYSPVIPAGVARQSTLANKQNELQQQLMEFAESIGFAVENGNSLQDLLTSCHEVSKVIKVQLFAKEHDIQLKGQVPKMDDNQVVPKQASKTSSKREWRTILPNTASGKHLLKFWLSHIYWQIVRGTTAEQVALGDGKSICYFNKANGDIKVLKDKQILSLQPITAEQATAELERWLMYAELCGQLPIVLMPEYALIYLENFYQQVNANQANSKSANFNNPYEYYPNKGDYSKWNGDGYNQSGVIYNSNSQHEVWRYVLGDLVNKPFDALRPALISLAEPMFGAMYWGLVANFDKEKN